MHVFHKKQLLDQRVLIFTLRGLLFLGQSRQKKIETDVAFKFSSKFACRIYSHSIMSLRGVVLDGGVTDSDFRTNIAVILTNTSNKIVEIEDGDRIAQVFFVKKEEIKFEEGNELDNTECGE